MEKNKPVKKMVSALAIGASVSDELVTGEFVGDTPSHMAADTPGIGPDALASAGASTVTVIDEDAAVSARVLCAVTIGADAYQPDEVIEGLPATISDQYAGSIDSHPDAVAHALAQGSPVKQFTAAE